MRNPTRQSGERGFVALMSVIIMSVILLVMVYTLETSSFFARFDALDGENKQVSYELAEGCVNSAMIKVAQNSSYVPAAGGDCLSVGGSCTGTDPQKVCKICSVGTSAGVTTVTTRALYNGAFTNLKVSFNATSYAITGWSETQTGVTTCTVP
jgi:hypothetical protein